MFFESQNEYAYVPELLIFPGHFQYQWGTNDTQWDNILSKGIFFP